MRHGRQRALLKVSEKIPPELALILGVGWWLAFWIVGGVFLGRWADSHFDIRPWGLVGGTLLGIAGSVYPFYRLAKQSEKKE